MRSSVAALLLDTLSNLLVPRRCCSFEAYSECLRLELRDWGVKVSIIEPGFFDTPIVQRSAENLEKVYRALPSVSWAVRVAAIISELGGPCNAGGPRAVGRQMVGGTVRGPMWSLSESMHAMNQLVNNAACSRRRRIEKVSGLAGNPKAVVDTMYNAVAARYPLPRYQVGWDCKIVYNLLYFLPSVVKDQIQHLLNRQGNRPAALSKKEE